MRLITKHLDLNIIGSAQTDKLRAIEGEVSHIHFHYYVICHDTEFVLTR